MHQQIEMPRIYTYDELLTDFFQTFGYFANIMNKTHREVWDYFHSRATLDSYIDIRGEYVRKKTEAERAERMHPQTAPLKGVNSN